MTKAFAFYYYYPLLNFDLLTNSFLPWNLNCNNTFLKYPLLTTCFFLVMWVIVSSKRTLPLLAPCKYFKSALPWWLRILPSWWIHFPKERSIHRVRVRPLPGCVKWFTKFLKMQNEKWNAKKYVRLNEIYYSRYLIVVFLSICTFFLDNCLSTCSRAVSYNGIRLLSIRE